jgi:hypothetical protein
MAGSRTAAAVVVAFVLALGAAACGGSKSSSDNGLASKSPQQILAAARQAAANASTVHVAGSMTDNGKPIQLDLRMDATQGAVGRIAESGQSFQLIRVGTAVYIKGTKAFYKSIGGPAAAQLLGGKWLKAPSGGKDFQSLVQVTSMRPLVKKALSPEGTVTKTGTSTVQGQQVVGLKDSSGGGVLYVAATGTAYPVQITGGSGQKGKITFTDWNESVDVKAPKNAVDIAKLK